MDIKKKIGLRIAQARKSAGLTVKQLSDQTIDLSASRISNWEQGTRSPGPLEVKQLALALNVPAAYLLCLIEDDAITSEYMGYMISSVVPILDQENIITKAKLTTNIKQKLQENNSSSLVPIAKSQSSNISSSAFCLQIKDESMAPELRINDAVIIDSKPLPTPGKFVVAVIEKQNTTVIRKYRELGLNSQGKMTYELIAINEDWPNTTVEFNHTSAKIIGTIIEIRRQV